MKARISLPIIRSLIMIARWSKRIARRPFCHHTEKIIVIDSIRPHSIKLLSDSDIIPLFEEQAASLSFRVDRSHFECMRCGKHMGENLHRERGRGHSRT
jgi:hypothetical protein